MSEISEEWNLQYSNLKINNENTSAIYAGKALKEIIDSEELEVDKGNVQDITILVKSVEKKQEEYVIIHEGKLYYVSQSNIKNNEEQVKWCEELGIRIWEHTKNTGIKVINGNYELVNGVYVCTPKLNIGFSKENTRYLNLRNGNLVPGDWIDKKPNDDWYDYDGDILNGEEPVWANIYVENNGLESYYVWIPRYVYKKDTENQTAGNQRMDVKFVDIDNSYKDADGNITTWEGKNGLKEQGYQLPEAFWWDNNSDEIEDGKEKLSGYWISKYQLSNLDLYTLDFDTAATVSSITIQNIKTNTTKTIEKYTYAINGKIIHESTNGEVYKITGLAKGNRTINVTALDENGEIVGSMTKIYEVAEVNEPDISKFDPDTTFYVYWDENGNEHNEVPISKEAPIEWYDYTTANWANIVTRNNGLETYFVWIPRYQYQLDSITKRTVIKFIKDTGTDVDPGYQIPEAFWWDNDGDGTEEDGERLKGYWITKYQLTKEESTPRMNAEMSAESNLIKINDITGTLIADAEINDINVKYEYYINGTKVHEGTSSTENYIYEGLIANTKYTINIIARNSDTDEFIGAVTKKITTN